MNMKSLIENSCNLCMNLHFSKFPPTSQKIFLNYKKKIKSEKIFLKKGNLKVKYLSQPF